METPITRHEFEAQGKMLQRILEKVEGDTAVPTLPVTWWDDTDLKNFLRISQRTLERRRKDNTFIAHKIGGRCYYDPRDIIKLRDGFLK